MFRFSPASLRRAYDRAGRPARCTTGWPGTRRPPYRSRWRTWSTTSPGGTAASGSGRPPRYLRLEDEAQAAALLTHPRARELGLRQVAPTVLVAAVEEAEVVALLQEAGHAPVVEDAAGRALRPPARLRAPPPAATARRPASTERRPSHGRNPAGGGPAYAGRRPTGPACPPPTRPWTGCGPRPSRPRPCGSATSPRTAGAVERELAPLDLAAGSVRAVDRASAQVVTIPLARISAVSPVPHSDPSVTS